MRKVVKSRYVPLLAIGAAYCFLVMMFNVPIPDGTTAHAVGGVLVAVLLGPWAAVVAVSSALAIQALFFGDGGVLAFGANCFNMAFVMPMVGYAVYVAADAPGVAHVAAAARSRPESARTSGSTSAALCAAIEFGLQPTLFHRADGTPLYAPFHLAQTIPAMALAHLTVAGGVEFALTAGVVAYLQRANLPLLRINHAAVPDTDAELGAVRRLGWRWALVGLGAMAVLTPLGLLAPGRRVRRGPPADLDLRRYHLERGARRPAALRRLLAPRALQRLRLLARPAPGDRLPRVGGVRPRDRSSARRARRRYALHAASCAAPAGCAIRTASGWRHDRPRPRPTG